MREFKQKSWVVAICLAIVPSYADTITGTGWKGTAGNNNWSSTGNWDAAAPNTSGTGDRNLFFGQGYKAAGGAGSTSPNNDLSGWHGYRITFQDSNASGTGTDGSSANDTAFTITGNGFTLFDFGGSFPRIENDSFLTQTFTLTSGQTLGLDGNGGGLKAEVNPVNGNIVISAGTKVDLGDTTQLQIFGSNGKTVTFNDVISSSGNGGLNSVSLNANSILQLGAANTYGGDTFVNNGTLRLSANNAVNSTTFIRLGDTSGAAGANLNLDAGFSQAASLNVRSGSSGSMVIANTPSTSGTATLSGNIFLDKDATLFANTGGGIALSGNTLDIKNQTLTIDGSGASTISGGLQNSTGSGKLVKNGSGTNVLSGNNSFGGSVLLNTGVLRLANNNAAGSGTKTIASTNRTCAVEVDGGVTIPNTIGFKLSNDATSGATIPYAFRSLTGVNTISGPIILTSGGGLPIITVDAGGTLNLNGAISNDVARTVVLQGSGTGNVNGIIQDWTGASAVTVSNGTWNLFGNNTYSGATTVSGGVLNMQHANALGGTSAGTTVANGAELQIQGGINTAAEPLTLNGTGLSSSGALHNISGINTYAGPISLGSASRINSDSGTLTLNSGTAISGATFGLAVGGSGAVSISSVIGTTTGTLTKDGSGTLTLTGGNTFSGATTISGGTISISADNNLGTAPGSVSAAAITLGNGATLATTASFTLNANRGTTISSGASATVDVASSTTLSYGGGIKSAGGTTTLVKSGAGTLNMNSTTAVSSRYTKLVVNNGIFSFVSGNNLPDTTASLADEITLNGGTLLFNNSALGVLSSARGVSLGVSGGTVSADASITSCGIGGVISGSGTLTKVGTGVLTLNAANTYSGLTAISQGALLIALGSGASPLGTAGAGTTVSSGAQLQTSGSAVTLAEPLTLNGTGLASDGALLITANGPTISGAITLGSTGVRLQNNGAGATLQGGITGSGFDLAMGGSAGWTVNTSPINIGSGILTMDGSATLTLSTVNTIGAFTFTGGRVNFNAAGCIGPASSTMTINSGALALTASGSLGTVTINNPVTLNSGAAPILSPAGSTTLELSGAISGAGGLVRDFQASVGGGTPVLSGANSFSGGVKIVRNDLVLGNKACLGVGTFTVGDPVTAPASAITLSATTALTGSTAVTNPVTVNRDFTLSGSSALEFAGPVSLVASPIVTVASTAGAVLSGNLSGAGSSFTKSGSGKLTLGGTNFFTGGVTVTAGTLLVNNTGGSGTGTGAVTIQTGAILGGNGTISGGLILQSGGTLSPGTSIGTLTLGSAPSLAGTNLMELNTTNSPATNDLLVLTSGTLTYGGTLTVTNTGAALTGGETFVLFSASAYSGSFGTTNLPSLGSGLNWYLANLLTNGSITVNRAPTAENKTYIRGKGISLKIKKSDLLVNAADADSGDSVSYDSLVSLGSQGATVTENSTTIFYTPANDNSDTLQYRLKDTRGGAVTKNISIIVTNAVGVVTITNNAGGSMTVGFFGIPGFDYVIQRSPDLSAWTDISTNTAPNDGEILFTETPPYNPAFYRTRQP